MIKATNLRSSLGLAVREAPSCSMILRIWAMIMAARAPRLGSAAAFFPFDTDDLALDNEDPLAAPLVPVRDFFLDPGALGVCSIP